MQWAIQREALVAWLPSCYSIRSWRTRLTRSTAGKNQSRCAHTHLRDRINTVLAHYNQRAQCLIPLEGGLYVYTTLRTLQVCKHTGGVSRLYLRWHLQGWNLHEVTWEQIGSLQGHLTAICSIDFLWPSLFAGASAPHRIQCRFAYMSKNSVINVHTYNIQNLVYIY